MELTMTHLVILTFLGFVVTILTIVFKDGKWRGNVEKAVEKLEQGLVDLTKKVDKIYEIYLQHGVAATLDTKSPIKLNQLGQEIANELNFDSIVDTHTLLLKAQAENLNPYEIQQLCFKYAQNDLVDELKEKSPDQFKAISLVAFNKGIPREDVLKIVGVLLRDRILKLMGYSDLDLK